MGVYLPVRYKATDACNTKRSEEYTKTPARTVTKTREKVLKALHESINYSLENVNKCAVIGLECKTSDNARILNHMMIGSYISDIPECEELLSVKRYYCSSSQKKFLDMRQMSASYPKKKFS